MGHQLEHLTLNRQTYFLVREFIEMGTLQPGSQLDERTIANNLNVSRTPLREAIATLVEEGLVERRPYRGNFVIVLSDNKLMISTKYAKFWKGWQLVWLFHGLTRKI